MKFTNTEEHTFTFDEVAVGDYFRKGENFYIKTVNISGDHYAVNLETGEEITIPFKTEVTLIDIKEIIYENV